ncbi:hypothetical protein FQN54_000761 [Arachnomyces sp. PD_36]|nr:hypothetical protein FQN54_000761 [Arachnomyces sp. PD_36]
MDQKETNISIIRTVLQQTFDHVLRYLGNLHKTSVATTTSLSDLRQKLNLTFPERQTEANEVINDLVEATNGGLLGSTGGRFFGWAVGGTLPSALAADWPTSARNQNGALSAVSPTVAVIEEVCGKWLKELLNLPPSASFALVSGCQMAHVTCLAAARHALLVRRGWDCERDGLNGSPRIRILSSSERHGSIERAVRLLGLGTRSVVDLPADENGCLQPGTLSEALAKDPNVPTILANITLDPAHRHLLAGAENADSWATDGHKWLNVPYDCGYAFITNQEAHRNSMSHRATYLTHDQDARDQIDWNPEWSRRGRGIATYAALRELGREGVANLVERCCRHAQGLLTGIVGLNGAELVWKSEINLGLVRFLDEKDDAESDDHDRRTDKVIAALAESGEAFFSGTTWRGRRYMRVSVLNWQTDEDDVVRVIEATNRILERE